MKTDHTQRQNKIQNFSIGTPIDFPRVEETHGGRSVFIGMFENFLDAYNDALGEVNEALSNQNDIAAVKDKV